MIGLNKYEEKEIETPHSLKLKLAIVFGRPTGR